MKRVALGALVLVLACSVLLLAGCSDDTQKANDAIEASNAAVDEANSYDAQAVELFQQIGALEPGAKSSQTALGLITRAEESIRKKNEKVQAAIDELSKIETMDVSDDFKTYAEQQIEIANLQRKSNELLLKATTEFKAIFQNAASKAPNMPALEASFANIDEIFAEADTLSTTIDEKAGASDAFFQEKGLGE